MTPFKAATLLVCALFFFRAPRVQAVENNFLLSSVGDWACRVDDSYNDEHERILRIRCFTVEAPERGAAATVRTVSRVLHPSDGPVVDDDGRYETQILRYVGGERTPGICVTSYHRPPGGPEWRLLLQRLQCFRLDDANSPLFTLDLPDSGSYRSASDESVSQMANFLEKIFGPGTRQLKLGEANPDHAIPDLEGNKTQNIYASGSSTNLTREHLQYETVIEAGFKKNLIAGIDGHGQVIWYERAQERRKGPYLVAALSDVLSPAQRHRRLWLSQGVVTDVPVDNEWKALASYVRSNGTTERELRDLADSRPHRYNYVRKKWQELGQKNLKNVRLTADFFQSGHQPDRLAPLWHASPLVWKLFLFHRVTHFIPYQETLTPPTDLKAHIQLELQALLGAGLKPSQLDPAYVALAKEVGALLPAGKPDPVSAIVPPVGLLQFLHDFAEQSPLAADVDDHAFAFTDELGARFAAFELAADVEAENQARMDLSEMAKRFAAQLPEWTERADYGEFFSILSTWLSNPTHGETR